MKSMLSLVSQTLSLSSRSTTRFGYRKARVRTFTIIKSNLIGKAGLVEMDDGNSIADLAVHVTFIKLSRIKAPHQARSPTPHLRQHGHSTPQGVVGRQ